MPSNAPEEGRGWRGEERPDQSGVRAHARPAVGRDSAAGARWPSIARPEALNKLGEGLKGAPGAPAPASCSPSNSTNNDSNGLAFITRCLKISHRPAQGGRWAWAVSGGALGDQSSCAHPTSWAAWARL